MLPPSVANLSCFVTRASDSSESLVFNLENVNLPTRLLEQCVDFKTCPADVMSMLVTCLLYTSLFLAQEVYSLLTCIGFHKVMI